MRYRIDYFLDKKVKCPKGKKIEDYLGDFYDFSYSCMERHLTIETMDNHEIFDIAKKNKWPLPVLIAANDFGLEFMFTKLIHDRKKQHYEDDEIDWNTVKGNVFIPWGSIKNLHGILNEIEFVE